MNIAVNLHSSELDIIQACIRKEEWAQQWVYEEFHHSMLGVCMRYASSENEAMDLLHEGFLKVFQNIHHYEPGTVLGAWIRRIMINTSIDYYRKEKRRITSDLEEATCVVLQSSNPLASLSVEEIMTAIQKLSPIYRSVFNLYVIEGFSHKEISEKLVITENTSRSNLVKARIKLKELLHESGE